MFHNLNNTQETNNNNQPKQKLKNKLLIKSPNTSPFSKDALLYILLQFAAAILHHGCHSVAKMLLAS